MLKSVNDLKKGMKVVVVSKKTGEGWNINNEMDYMLGKTYKVIGNVYSFRMGQVVEVETGPNKDLSVRTQWYLCNHMIDWKKTNEVNSKTEQDRIITHIGIVDRYTNKTKGVIVVKRGGLQGKAKCHPRDMFNQGKGTYLATLRLSIKEANKEIKRIVNE